MGALAASMMIGARIALGVLLGDDAAESGGNEQIDVELQELLVGDPLGVGVALRGGPCCRGRI